MYIHTYFLCVCVAVLVMHCDVMHMDRLPDASVILRWGSFAD